MFFKPKNQSSLYVPTISLNKDPVIFVPNYKYLEIIVNVEEDFINKVYKISLS